MEDSSISDVIVLYHGSGQRVSELQLGIGNPFNDYGLGFYTSPSFKMAAEWAVPAPNKDGFVNQYELIVKDLSILYLDEQPFEHWVSVLLQNRGVRFNREVNRDINRFIQKYPFDLSTYDIICGHRADDAYFSFVRDFYLNILSIENLKKAMYLGNLRQYCLLSQQAYDATNFIDTTRVLAKHYHASRIIRNDIAKDNYRNIPNKREGALIIDIIR